LLLPDHRVARAAYRHRIRRGVVPPADAKYKEVEMKPGILGMVVAAGCAPAVAHARSNPTAEKTAERIDVATELGTPVVLAGSGQRAFLKVGLKGLEAQAAKRAPVNVSIVIDRSGSMQGQKLSEAKTAAAMAVRRLGPSDVVSVVAYDDTVTVIVPAQRVTDAERIIAAIDGIHDGGSTALFAGVSHGAAEVRKFLDRQRVNRVILLSDGLANVGPSSPGALAELGASLAKEGISVTTFGLGLGFNEDLMMQLARASDGNHAFIEHAEQLAKIFEAELGDVLAVVAQDVDVRITCAEGIQPLRVLGRDAVIDGRTVTARLNQLYAGQEKFLLLEVELPALAADTSRPVASVAVSYADLPSGKSGRIDRETSVKATASATLVESSTIAAVMIAAAELLANEQTKLALALRDEGKVDEAKRVLENNAELIRTENKKLKSKRLETLEQYNRSSAGQLEGEQWNQTRKSLRGTQHQLDTQQSYH
jgi:Ca-activated chloride channel homolog